MRRFFFYFIAVAFVLRGFMGDAMAVTMAHDAMKLPASLSTATASEKTSPMPGCHEMAQGGDTRQDKSSSMSHASCQLCCAVIAVPSPALLTFDQAAFFARPVGFRTSFASNDLLPAFKPPIL
jgi:hypothetical protein